MPEALRATNAQFHLVDERIVGDKPRSVDFAQAAALPLAAISAWEALFDRIDIRRPVPDAAPAVRCRFSGAERLPIGKIAYEPRL
jgi:NADPH:quinone reductase-like Zn-dependent oxidoreductase